MVDMRSNGGQNPSPVDSGEESKFTAVNNNNGNGAIVPVHRPQLPPLGTVQTATNTSASASESPRYSLAGDEHWHRAESGEVAAGASHKRKRSPDRSRALTPTTQATQHHLAAHEAALASDEHSGSAHHLHRQLSATGDDPHGGYVDEDTKMHESDRTRAGTLEGSPQPGGQQGGKGQRKRVFSNRTKTGCITCRRRKKKCDEGKPECCNCRRGGFVCEGYSGKINWQKPPGKSASTAGTPVNIQSKTDQQQHQPASASASPTPTTLHNTPHPHRIDEPTSLQQHHQPSRSYHFTGPTAPIMIEEQQPQTDDSTSPTSAEKAMAPHPFLVGQTPTQTAFQSTLPPLPLPNSSPHRTEKEKMLASELYYPDCPTLVRERALCRAACWRFNASANPDLGVSATEQHRLLLQVLRPETTWSVNRSSQSGYVDSAGNSPDVVDVQVDQPFECTYGYNIHLGKGVHIEAGCNILDSCTVTIKARTILSPRVSVFSATHPIDPRKRNGSKGPASAKPITIEEDCWLGGGAVVLPGISIGRGSVVGAGSVVTKNVPPYTVVAGNPAKVIRGIYRNDNADM